MKLKFLKYALLMSVAMVITNSCEDDPEGPDSPGERAEPLVMTYDDFITPNDVRIISADTTYISVSSAYAAKMGIDNFKNRAVTIWRTIGTVPFVRIITDSKVEDGEIVLTTTKGEFCDMFDNIEFQLESDIYVDPSQKPVRATRSGTDEEVDDVSGKYIDEEGVYHPAVVILDENSEVARSIQTRSGAVKNYYTAEELLESNIAFDIINLSADYEFDYQYPPESDDDDDDDDDDGGASAHLKGKVGISAKLSAYANISVGWFKLSKFEAGVKGSVGASAKLSVSMEKELEEKWEKKLASLGKTTMVYWVGIVPVPFTLESSLMQRTNASASASVELLASGKYTLQFEKGIKYEHGYGWSNTSKSTKSEKAFNFDGIKGTASVEASTGTYYVVGFFLAGSAGPEMSFGPSLSAEAEVAATVDSEGVFSVEAGLGAYAALSGKVGAKIKVLGYTLAKWETKFDLFKVTLFEGSLSWSYTEDSWRQIDAEWTNIMNQNSSQWTW